jgi:hypothetical protein
MALNREPSRYEQFQRILKLREAGAAWHEIAEVLWEVHRAKDLRITGDFTESEFEAVLANEAGLSNIEAMRMIATYSRVRLFAGGWHPNNLLSDDMGAVELALRLGWADPNEGRLLLLGLKEGSVSKNHLVELLAERDGVAAVEGPSRELRAGAHLFKTARSLGWPDDGGEGAQEFLLRRTREVAIEDCTGHEDEEQEPYDAGPASTR